MFESIRKHSKIVMFLLFLLIIPSFVFVGVSQYSGSTGKETVVAKVDGKEITQGEWDAAHSRQVESIRAQMPNFDTKSLDTAAARYASLELLVRSRVTSAALEKSHIRASDAKVGQTIREYPELATALNPDGSLDMEKFRALVAPGVTPQMLRESIRAELSMRQFTQGVGGTGFSSAAQADVTTNALFEQREIQVAVFKNTDFALKAVPADAEISTYYQQHLADFQIPEKATIEYLALSPDNIQKTIVATEQELKTGYDAYISGLASGEERRASHILVSAGKDMPAAERDKAKATAQDLLAAVRKLPASFSDVAKKNSADTGSATQGGDLDFFKRSAMVKPFADAAFAMKKGDISDVVETEFGFHIIQLTDIKAPKQRSFEEMRPALEAAVRQQKAGAKFAETAESFSNDVYEQSDSLKPIADRLKLPLLTAVVNRIAAPGASGALSSEKFLAAIFAPDAFEKKRNTRAIDVGANQLVSGRVVEYSAARASTLDEVRPAVIKKLVAEQSAQMAKKEGAAKLAEWSSDAAGAKLPAAVVVSRRAPKDQPAQILDAAIRVKPTDKPVFVGVDLPGTGYAVVKVNKALPPEPVAADTQRQQREQYSVSWGMAEDDAYYRVLKERFKAQIKVGRPDTGKL